MARSDEPPLAPVPAHSGWQRLREGLPLVMSVLAFVLSLTSLYLVTLRAGNVSAMTGPALALSHEPVTGAARISLAVNLANTGARLITVAGMQLQITTPDNKRLALTARTQQTLDGDGEPRDSSLLAPITLAARSESTRQLGFVASGNDASLLQPGRYQLALLLSAGSDNAMHPAEQWQIEISENEARQLQHWYELGIGNSVMLAKP
jgi:hypothetical protein